MHELGKLILAVTMGMVAHQFVKICRAKAPKGFPGLPSPLSRKSLGTGSGGLHWADVADGAWDDGDEGVWEGEK